MDPLHLLVLGIITITHDSRFADGSIRTIIRHCCDIGKQWYFHSDHSCPTHPMIDNARDKHTPCLLAVEVCCTTEMRKQRCLVGKKLALQGETNSEVNEDAKECYSCCRLGLKASMDVRGCQKLPRSNLFTSQCRQIFSQCCNQKSSDNLTHPSKEPEPCNNNGLHCSIFEKCVPHKRWGFVCVHINNEQTEHKMDSRTTSHKTSVLDATTLFEDVNYCQNGYAFNKNKMLCEDVNECLEHPKACDPSHMCQNEPGSYRCLPRLIDINNELPKSHRHRHADGPIADRHPVANRATTMHYNNKFFGHRPTLHSKFDANDESMASIDRPTLSGDSDFFLEVNNFVVDMTHIDTTRDKSDTKDLRNSRVDDERVFHPIHKMERRCNEGQKYNDFTKECEELIKCEGRNCHQTTNMICEMKLGKEFCTCKPGFRYNPRTDSCDDLDECSETKHTCGEDERCENTHGSYVCLSRVGSCSRGYHHDQLSSTCIDVDECASQLHNCTSSQICNNLPGSFLCSTPSCPPGMIADEQNRCVPEMTDCSVDTSVCHGNKICTNISGRYSCHDPIFCGIGFKLNADVNKCQDVDECYEDSHNCTGHHMFCSNLIGQFKCECIHGFNYDVVVHSCEDVDECLLLQPCPSNALCRNTRGSFVCSCEIGFQIQNDLKHCVDINECSTGIHSCEQECSNTLGSYYCSCQEGFKLNNDGFSCSDKDECTTVDNKCQNDDEMCVNTWGSHRCHPTSCPPGFVRHSNDRSLLRKLSIERDHKQIFLSLEHPSIHRPITSSFSRPIFYPQIHHKRNVGWNWQLNSGRINFDSAKEALHRDPKWPVLTIGESPDVVCKRIPCPPADSRCRNNSVASIQWHQLLLPIGELKPHTPIASIKRAQDLTTSESSIRIVEGDRNSPFEIRRDSGGGGHIHVLRDLNSLKTYELVLSVRTSSRRGEAISEHVLNIIINTTPQFIT